MRSQLRRDEPAFRFLLGMGQMFGAVVALVLLLATGLSRITVIATVLTTALTVTSRLLSFLRK
jgi:fumarate reductase subunit D